MAYGVKYRFHFESVDGVEWTIDVLKNGYSGSVISRALGGSPIIRKDKNDNICGTSLELVAECQVDGEFEEFYTNDPFEYQVKVYDSSSSLVWQGYITPEMYRAPDVSTRYDVRVTATDGLGELKLNNFEAQGTQTISTLLSYLLGFTGLSLPFNQASDLSCSAAGAGSLLSSVYVNLDHMVGMTCYDVLQALLASIHSSITQYGSCWFIFKETGLSINQSNHTFGYYNEYGVSKQMGILQYGNMATYGYWPVGYMSREYIAPKKKITIISENNYKQNLLGAWTLDGNTTNEGAYFNLPSAGDGITQTVTFSNEVQKHLILSIKVRNYGDGQDAGTLSLYVKLSGIYYQQASPYIYLERYTGRQRNPAVDVIWTTNSSVTCDYEVQAPAASDTDQDYITIDVLIPLYQNSPRSYVKASSLEFTIFNGDSLYPKRIYGVTLSQYEQTKGFKQNVNIDNGARGEAPDVNVAFACTESTNDYDGLEELQYGVPMDSSQDRITSWGAGIWSGDDYLTLISRDYSLSFAEPRIRVTGTLQTEATLSKAPLMFIDGYDSVPYIVETFSWDLYNDEITVEMISLPTSSLNIDSESIDAGETDNATNHTQGNPSSGGGGGGYTLPIASSSVLGGIKVGSGLSIDSSTGVLSATGGGSVTVTNYGNSSTGKIATVNGTDIYNDVKWGGTSGYATQLTVNGTQKTVLVNGWSELPSVTSSDNGKVLKVVSGEWAAGTGSGGNSVSWGTPGSDYVPLTVDGTTKNLLTDHQSLANYVTLNTTQTITGEKTFTTKPVHVGSTSGIDVDSSSYIDIGDARLQYDPSAKALHITVKSGSETIGLYADGFVSAGGSVASGNQIKFVSLTGAQNVDGVKTFLANLIANGTVTINGVTLTGSSSALSVSKNASFSGISDKVNGSTVTHAVSIQDIVNRLVALES